VLLAVDIGNTNITLGLYGSERALQHRWALTSDTHRTADEYRLLLRQITQECPDLLKANHAILASVVPALRPLIETAIRKVIGPDEIRWLEPDTPLPVRNGYPKPDEVGADRLANAVGGFRKYCAPLIVVDMGTATTFDVIDNEPCYLGGIIMPGPRLAAEALHHRTARLPLIEPHFTDQVIAASTVEAINSGLFLGTAGAIDSIIQRIRADVGVPEMKAIATGGLAPAFVEACENLALFDRDLTLDGLAAIFDYQSK
jgi:type III pantothenate kinase